MNFKDTGIPSTLKVDSKSGAGTVISAFSGKKIVIMDVIASAATTIKDGSSGSNSMLMQAGIASKLNINIGGAGAEVYSTAGDISITYYIL